MVNALRALRTVWSPSAADSAQHTIPVVSSNGADRGAEETFEQFPNRSQAAHQMHPLSRRGGPPCPNSHRT